VIEEDCDSNQGVVKVAGVMTNWSSQIFYFRTVPIPVK